MINIAIDGPAGAGKSSAAKLAAKKLGYIYVDTGALYRAVGVAVLRRGLDTSKKENVIPVLTEIRIELKFEDGTQRVYLNDEDVSDEIRLPEASMAASNVSAIPAVRAFLFDLQRNIAKKNDCIMDGRDIGTVVLPQAECKIYLTASSAVRAHRRFLELQAKGETPDEDQIRRDIEERDERDKNREISPLKQADDAVLLDTSDLNIDEAVERILAIYAEKTGRRA
jgi:cytidylate kinase